MTTRAGQDEHGGGGATTGPAAAPAASAQCTHIARCRCFDEFDRHCDDDGDEYCVHADARDALARLLDALPRCRGRSVVFRGFEIGPECAHPATFTAPGDGPNDPAAHCDVHKLAGSTRAEPLASAVERARRMLTP